MAPQVIAPVVFQLFEKLVYVQVYSHLNTKNLIYSDQYGFQSFHSVLASLLKCTNDWYLNMDKGQYTSVTFVGLQKAFSTVDHQILLNKLKMYGLVCKEITWLEAYLGNRTQRCRINGQTSELQHVKLGVPQGSCLGPLLCLIYI